MADTRFLLNTDTVVDILLFRSVLCKDNRFLPHGCRMTQKGKYQNKPLSIIAQNIPQYQTKIVTSDETYNQPELLKTN